jgi:putative ABC transport system ATP-binding protein
MIELNALTKSYLEAGTDRIVLEAVSAVIPRGEFLILLGRSGSGKSTLLNLIGGIDLPTSGEVTIAGTCLTRLNERDRTLFRRRSIGFIFQFFNLVPTLTVLENLLLPLELNGRSLDEGEAGARILLAEVGLADRAASYPERLSGGEQQRVAIARALVHDPDVLLADEPTGNLDRETGGQVIELLSGLVRRKNKTLIMATHSMDPVSLADRVMTVRDGKLVPLQPEE